MSEKKEITIEEGFENLNDILKQMDDKNVPLEKSFELYNQLSRFQATVQFIKCETDKQKEVMYFLLGNLCAAKSSKQVQVYIVQEEKNAIPLEHLKNKKVILRELIWSIAVIICPKNIPEYA